MEDSRKRPIDGEGSEDDKDIKKAKGMHSLFKINWSSKQSVRWASSVSWEYRESTYVLLFISSQFARYSCYM